MAYKFGLDFQRHILAAIISDEQFLRLNLDSIKPEYFNDDLLSGICEICLEFFYKEKECASDEAILHEVTSRLAPGRKLHEYVDELRDLRSRANDNRTYYQSKAIEFARTQAVANAVRDAVPLLEAGEIDEIGRLVADALRSGSTLSGDGIYDYYDTAQERLLGYIDPLRDGGGQRVPSGFYPIDEMLQGGLGAGELGIIVALPKHGKTTALVNMSAHALLCGKKVAYVTLELSRKMIASKFDVHFFGESLDGIKSKPAIFAGAIKKMRDKLNGKLKIIEFPTKSATVERLTSSVLQAGGADVIFIDYGQLIKALGKRDERRHEITDVYESIRRMAGELQVPIWTAHQANRMGTTSRTILPEHIAEDFNILAIADVAISLNQTEEEARIGKLRLYNMGNRLGPSGMFVECSSNWATSTIRVTAGEEDLTG